MAETPQAGEGQPGPAPEPGAASQGDAPSEEEVRRRLEEGLRKVRVQDVVLESVATIVNLTARRIAKADERDLDQAKVGIEAVRSLVDLLEPEPQAQVRNALSELQMLYARHAGEGAKPGGGGESAAPDEGSAAARDPGAGEAERPEPGQGPPPGLWVPPGSA